MLDVTTFNDRVQIGRHFSVTFERTLRIPDDGREYPLPPSLGHFPVRRVADYADRVPPAWREHGGVFLPMYQREAMWLNFSGAHWRPHALKVALGKVNALSGKPYHQCLAAGEQDYVVAPPQPWLDGINAGDGFIKQFVAMPLGQGYTVEGQLTGEETHGGLQLVVFDPKPGRFPDQAPHVASLRARGSGAMAPACAPAGAVAAEMGLAAGGRMRQQLYPDPHGLDTWDEANFGRVYVHIANSEAWTRITGEPLPPTPVDVRAYLAAGLPWFDLYDDHLGDIGASGVLAGVKSVDELDAQHVADGVW
ncbi:hypothetical protein OM076_18180 [Solirubrobacter ginsenosidimutans]|uniref:Uncharacterized protein n=1 Tax=Solirubrobacter ginsenosidimutans TaxID=490573 RepID=A0A9X3MUL0_9ACTN|nr:hypothetical protein [Solirubrobacter ginsenosidimutans]MDA0162206.1 hypothetical protein [Solirubrobacter ginsenosidimutans]